MLHVKKDKPTHVEVRYPEPGVWRVYMYQGRDLTDIYEVQGPNSTAASTLVRLFEWAKRRWLDVPIRCLWVVDYGRAVNFNTRIMKAVTQGPLYKE